jgi:hypothetical protein
MEIYILGIAQVGLKVALVPYNILMEKNMKDYLQIMKKMVKENTILITELYMRVFGRVDLLKREV